MMNKFLATLALLSVAACGLPVQGTAPEQDAPFPASGDRLDDFAPARQGKDPLPADAVDSKVWAETFVCLSYIAGAPAEATVPVIADADCQALCYNANLERKMRLEHGMKACPAEFKCEFVDGNTRPGGDNACHIVPVAK